MAIAYTAEERAALDARAQAILDACPDVGAFIRRGLGGDPDARRSSICAPRSIPRPSSRARETSSA